MLVLALVFAPALAHAQLGVYQVQNPATGERYNVEFSYGFWNPTPAITIGSNPVPVVGTEIDAVADLGFQQKKFRDLHLILRLAKKHKFRFEYLPVTYASEAVLTRPITYRGVSSTVGLPVNSSLDWKAYNFGYEYDLLYRDRGFLGVIGEVKYTRIRATVASPAGSATAEERAPIPALGVIARGYLARNLSLTAEITAFSMPDNVTDKFTGRYVDVDLYGTLNFSDSVGVQGGYRSLDGKYRASDDYGNLKLKGLYFRGVLRF
jgi:hypothetical protein